ncbi:fungal-specific transcription factor domain-containing protein [Aspergillus alliaceus]|uniref:Fungal-specific transcription factor domain-containing protein n=1 Tax=Petromyces alliaceus TaxID=209559 RepID=A0A5N7CB34_PETAA|nr:fungal-specific transcription factor domain-containing protein [Aspergillus alliaceus]
MPRRVVALGRSCLECRRRKVKCDRSLPCAYCVRTKIQCTCPHPKPDKNVDHVDRDLVARSFPFRLAPSPPLGSIHPPSAVIAFIWQTYLDVVDPVIKVFHVPTVQRQVLSVIQRRSNLDAPTECLMFAIYYSTVVTMSGVECRSELHEGKTVLLRRYRTGVEHALGQANFLRSLDMTVLQAFVLYLICGRRDENGPDVSMLVGLAIGTAMRMGLHCDGASLGLSPFEVEMRRRLWWQIYTLDVRMAEDHSSEPSILESTFNTELPSNVGDAGLNPDMSKLPQVQPGRTEMTFTLVRMMFSERFCNNNSYPVLSEAHKCKVIDQFKEYIEKQYLSDCDKDVSIDFITLASTRLILVTLKLAVCRPQKGRIQGKSRRANYLSACEGVLRHAQTLRRYEKGERWLWLFQTYVEWDALAYLLLSLCMVPSEEPSDAAWNDPDIYRDRRWIHVELRSQALTVRDRMRTTRQMPQGTQPDPSWVLVNAAATAAAHSVTEDVPSSTAELPGAGTICEWSAALFGQYWEMAEPRQGPSASWL